MIYEFRILDICSFTNNVNCSTITTFRNISIKNTIFNLCIITYNINCTCISGWIIIRGFMLKKPKSPIFSIRWSLSWSVSTIRVFSIVLCILPIIIRVTNRHPSCTVCTSFTQTSNIACKVTIFNTAGIHADSTTAIGSSVICEITIS